MTNTSRVISLSGVSKRFRLIHEPPLTLQKAVHHLVTGKKSYEDIWALNDISFTVRKGETLGIIGANASGKTTLLRLIAGIYPATRGTVACDGRIAPSLELGAGFLNEFTAAENLGLYGAVFGLTRKQVAAKLGPIAQFAGLEGFMDVPVRQFSMGMRMRLAFALAAEVQPDILLIDEMLAVGDIAFKEKCFRRIAELKASGMTLVLVSHAMEEIERLCDRALLLEKGTVVASGECREVVARYRERMAR